MKKYIFTAIVLISVVLAGCDTNGGTVELTVNETSTEITEVTKETIRMNNCGGAGEVKQVAERSKSVNIEYAGSLGVDKVVVNGEVSAKYGEINATAKKMELVAPAGTNMEFLIEWTEKTWIGIVTAQGKNGQADYKVSVPISVELISSQNLGCVSTSNSVPTNPPTSSPSTSTQNTLVSTDTPLPLLETTETPNWAIIFEYRFPAGFWSAGTHEYTLDSVCPNLEGLSGSWTNTFNVSTNVALFPGDVYLRLVGLREEALPSTPIESINPSQTTTAAFTVIDSTHSEAELAFTDCKVSIRWDGGISKNLTPGLPFER